MKNPPVILGANGDPLRTVDVKPRKKYVRRRRDWEAGKATILNADWLSYATPPNSDIRNDLKAVRARSRRECQNNDHARHFLRLVKQNVIGKDGVVYQAKAKTRTGKADQPLNEALEAAWKDWGRMGQCDVSGRLSWRSVNRLAIETAARDGEVLVRLYSGWDNASGFAVQLIDPESLDVDHNVRMSDGREIVMGVEMNQFRRPIAYHFIKAPLSADRSYYALRSSDRERVPAEEIVHWYLPEWVNQTRGVPWFATALVRAHQLAGYEDAEVVGARTASSKMGFYQQDLDAVALTGDDEDEQGNLITDARPGEFEILPPGYTFQSYDPQHPNAQFPHFVKAMLRGIASGLGANYNTLANDLEGVNYTSLRHGSLTERDVWMSLQNEWIEGFIDPIFRAWMASALLDGAVAPRGRPRPGPARLGELCTACVWQPRRWQWVDPLKETQAQREQYALNQRSVSSFIREQGDDPMEVFEEIAAERELFEQLGLPLPGANAPMAQVEAPTLDEPDEGDDNVEDDPDDD